MTIPRFSFLCLFVPLGSLGSSGFSSFGFGFLSMTTLMKCCCTAVGQNKIFPSNFADISFGGGNASGQQIT